MWRCSPKLGLWSRTKQHKNTSLSSPWWWNTTGFLHKMKLSINARTLSYQSKLWDVFPTIILDWEITSILSMPSYRHPSRTPFWEDLEVGKGIVDSCGFLWIPFFHYRRVRGGFRCNWLLPAPNSPTPPSQPGFQSNLQDVKTVQTAKRIGGCWRLRMSWWLYLILFSAFKPGGKLHLKPGILVYPCDCPCDAGFNSS